MSIEVLNAVENSILKHLLKHIPQVLTILVAQGIVFLYFQQHVYIATVLIAPFVLALGFFISRFCTPLERRHVYVLLLLAFVSVVIQLIRPIPENPLIIGLWFTVAIELLGERLGSLKGRV